MRVATIATCLSLVMASTAHADTAEELRIHGEALAKNGRFSEAIDAFKAAERKDKSPWSADLTAEFERESKNPNPCVGTVLLSETVLIGPLDTAGTLHDRLSAVGAHLLPRALAAST